MYTSLNKQTGAQLPCERLQILLSIRHSPAHCYNLDLWWRRGLSKEAAKPDRSAFCVVWDLTFKQTNKQTSRTVDLFSQWLKEVQVKQLSSFGCSYRHAEPYCQPNNAQTTPLIAPSYLTNRTVMCESISTGNINRELNVETCTGSLSIKV